MAIFGEFTIWDKIIEIGTKIKIDQIRIEIGSKENNVTFPESLNIIKKTKK